MKKDFGWLENVERANKPARLPVVFTKQDVNEILAQLEGTTWLIASLLYGAGLRVMECHRLVLWYLSIDTGPFGNFSDICRLSQD